MQLDFLDRLGGDFKAEFEALVRYVRRHDATPAEAEDAAQQAFLKAHETAVKGGWDQIREPRAWIRKVALRHYWGSLRCETPVGAMPNDAPSGPGHAELTDQALDAVAVLRRLDRLTRDVLALRMDGAKTGEIAECLGIDRQKVQNRRTKARHDLHRSLSPPVRESVANRVVADAESLMVHGGDLRILSPGDREETRTEIAEWRRRLRGCRSGAFGKEGSAILLGRTAALAEALIADRDENTALDLLRATAPHMRFMGDLHPAVFEVRRACAEAHSSLGDHLRAERILRKLGEDELRKLGATDPRTALLLHWALGGQGRLREAEEGFAALEALLARSPGSDPLLLLHARCRNAWLLGRSGRVDESVGAYTRVISGRTGGLGEDHPDTLDARHSQGKALVVAGRGEQALSLLRDLPEARARVQGDRHSDTLETRKYRGVAEVLAEPRDDRVLEDAIHDLEEILHVQIRRHGPDHPMSRDTAGWHDWLRRVREASRSREPLPGL